MNLTQTQIHTPLGAMIAIADEQALYQLEFEDQKYASDLQAKAILGTNATLTLLQQELAAYFQGKLTHFTTPLHIQGTPFQQQAWKALRNIPFGETCSYLAQAIAISKPTAFRAVANANSRNKFAIIVPCHRVVRENGDMGGYAGGIHRKEWLLTHEKKFIAA